MNELTCLICGAAFQKAHRRRSYYCSDDCVAEANRRRGREFYRRKNGCPRSGDRLESECRDCGKRFTYVVRKRRRRVCDSCRRANQTDPTDPTNRFRKHGVTREWYEQQLARQDGKCGNKVCGTEDPGHHGTFYIDHDHVTGEARGLLCPRCNFAIGHARDDIDVLAGLVDYLRPSRQLRLVI